MYNLRSGWSVLGLSLLTAVLTVVSYFIFEWHVIPGLSVIWSLSPMMTTVDDIYLVLVPIGGYSIISGLACMTVNTFRPLKKWSEKGLKWHLWLCFMLGLPWCLFGLVALDLPLGPAWGLIVGLTGGLILCLGAGLIIGLWMEFFD